MRYYKAALRPLNHLTRLMPLEQPAQCPSRHQIQDQSFRRIHYRLYAEDALCAADSGCTRSTRSNRYCGYSTQCRAIALVIGNLSCESGVHCAAAVPDPVPHAEPVFVR